ncbi:MAG: hypothetical protein SFV32_12630 [Opitutaceae bacterium]|nr:hypothetical protein [Opitutaceae bacterium]
MNMIDDICGELAPARSAGKRSCFVVGDLVKHRSTGKDLWWVRKINGNFITIHRNGVTRTVKASSVTSSNLIRVPKDPTAPSKTAVERRREFDEKLKRQRSARAQARILVHCNRYAQRLLKRYEVTSPLSGSQIVSLAIYELLKSNPSAIELTRKWREACVNKLMDSPTGTQPEAESSDVITDSPSSAPQSDNLSANEHE